MNVSGISSGSERRVDAEETSKESSDLLFKIKRIARPVLSGIIGVGVCYACRSILEHSRVLLLPPSQGKPVLLGLVIGVAFVVAYKVSSYVLGHLLGMSNHSTNSKETAPIETPIASSASNSIAETPSLEPSIAKLQELENTLVGEERALCVACKDFLISVQPLFVEIYRQVILPGESGADVQVSSHQIDEWIAAIHQKQRELEVLRDQADQLENLASSRMAFIPSAVDMFLQGLNAIESKVRSAVPEEAS